MIKEESIKSISEYLKEFPKKWDGKKAIIEMKENNFNQWRQMEWIGFYFEYLCQKYLKDIMEFHKIKYGRTYFDGFFEVPFDFKAHALNTESHNVVINDTEAIENAIEEFGCVVTIMALGKVIYNDEDRKFQKWHQTFKGGKSKYEKEREKRGAWSRLRKIAFDTQEIILIKINKGTLERCGSFQKNFRNANGSPRRSKVMLNLDKLNKDEIIEKIEF